ncbi:MAG: hypothetical protein ABIK65_09030 [Candidatus Eisenbacteria bacterium]
MTPAPEAPEKVRIRAASATVGPRRTGIAAPCPIGPLLFIPLACLLFAPSLSFALDGRLDLRNTYQEGRAGGEEFSAHTRREEILLRQPIGVRSRFTLATRFRVLREFSDSRIQGTSSDFEAVTLQPGANLDYSSHYFRLGLQGSGYRREFTADSEAPVLERLEYGGWVNLRSERGTNLDARWQRNDSRRDVTGIGREEVRESALSLGAEQGIRRVGRFKYAYSRLRNDAVDREVLTTHQSHTFEYRGSGRFREDRGDIQVRANSRYFDQKVESPADGSQGLYVTPLSGGYLLDDTPEAIDPLEDGPTQVSGLYDRDRSTPTEIDLGDDASMVREFGGDYRNLLYDFGDETRMDSVFLYVDRILLTPDLYRWRIFVSNDPERSQFEEVSPADFTIRYRELGTGFQGWEFVFPAGITARFLKIVDVKIGETEPELFITELEVFSKDEDSGNVRTEDNATHRIDGSVGYAVTDYFRVRYDGLYRERVFSETNQDLVERSHGFSSQWDVGRLLVSGRYETHSLSSPTRKGTDTENMGVSLRAGRSGPVSGTFAWSRSRDRSGNLDKATDNYSLGFNWQIAPALRFDQKVTHGRLDDFDEGLLSSSYSLATNVRARPVATVNIDLRRTDRWVDLEAGTGFTRFNDTSITLAWIPFPQLNYRSEARYQVRGDSNWITQNLLSWSPFPGGDLEPRLTLSHFRDTRNDSDQRGAGATMLWKVYPRLRTEGDLQFQQYRRGEEKSSPITGGFRVALTF